MKLFCKEKEKTRMARHNDLGDLGEMLAAGWLTEKGFSILYRNYRHGHAELDIIAKRDKVYHFIEIKSRKSTLYGYPEEGVSRVKLQNMMRVAAHWLYEHHISSRERIQYDVLAILLTDGKAPEYALFEDISF